MPNHAEQLAQELNLNVKNVQGAIELIDQGNTIPFIARYRKEATGSMDDQVLRDLGDRLEYLRGLDKRKDEVTSSITEQGAMTPELTAALSKAKTLAEVEDIYRPYKPKRKTRASIAKARGLQPLATAIFRQDAAFDPEKAAADYLNDEVPDAAAALAGAQDIIAEAVSDDAACRAELRRIGGGAHPGLAVKDDRTIVAREIADPVERHVHRAGNAFARMLVGTANVDQARTGIDRGTGIVGRKGRERHRINPCSRAGRECRAAFRRGHPRWRTRASGSPAGR
mgnify:CR=1 FL=1